MSNINVTIIIPTYKDWRRLSLCMEALSKQTFSSEMFEVIVVNNNTDDSIPSDFFLPNNAIVIREEKPGSYAARNAALRIAKGNIIGFTDSDCIPDKDWIKNATEYLDKNPQCTRIAGKVSIFCKSSHSRIELYDRLYSFNQKGYVMGAGTCVTANLFTYKYVFDNIGYFDETLMSGGDFSWGTLAHKKGYKIEYADNVIVQHPARNTLKELLKKERRVGGSQAMFLNESKKPFRIFFQYLRDIMPQAGRIKFIVSKGKDLSMVNKFYLFFLRQYLLNARAYAKLKVQLGKKSNRA